MPDKDLSTLADRGRARIGVIVPVSNTNLEPDMVLMKPAGVSIHFNRAGGYDLDQVPDSAQMAKFADATLEPVLDSLIAARPHVILYGCTSATLTHGPDYDDAFCRRIEKHSGIPGITAAGALHEALIDLGISTAAFASPYTEALNSEGAKFMAERNITICHTAYIGSDLGNYGQGELMPQEVFELGLRADHERADAIILSCTDMRSVEIISRLEATLNKPVVCSNQAMMYVACKKLGLSNTVPGELGTLNTG